MTGTDKWNGFGVLATDSADAREGLGQVREEMRDGFAEHIEEMDDP